MKGARIGIAGEMLGFNPQVDQLFKQALEVIKKQGGEIVPDLKFNKRKETSAFSYQVLLFEFKAGLKDYLSNHTSASVKSLEEIIAYNESHADKEMPWFGQDIFKLAQEKSELTSEEYLKALKSSKLFSQKEGIDALTEQHHLDAIIAPTNGPAWTIDWVNGDHFSGSSSSPAAISGYPNITVPMGYVQGLPVGISFFGKAWCEPVLLRLAYVFEQATKHRNAPEFKPSVETSA
jgi:amidase